MTRINLDSAAILPKRLLESVSKAFNIKLPNMSDDKFRQANASQLKNAKSIICFIDEEGKQVGRSIGTKVEYERYKPKIAATFEVIGDRFFPSAWQPKEPLPTYEDYIKGLSGTSQAVVTKVQSIPTLASAKAVEQHLVDIASAPVVDSNKVALIPTIVKDRPGVNGIPTIKGVENSIEQPKGAETDGQH